MMGGWGFAVDDVEGLLAVAEMDALTVGEGIDLQFQLVNHVLERADPEQQGALTAGDGTLDRSEAGPERL